MFYLSLAMEKKCSKCGTAFGCQNNSPGCWCETVALSKTSLDVIKRVYENCLCPACLKGYENKIGDRDKQHNTEAHKTMS